MTDSTINHFSEEICSESSASRNIVADWLKTHQAELIDTANYIFANPELAYQEQKSSVRLSTYLQEQGFTVSGGTANIETAFTATGHRKTNPWISRRIRCTSRCRTCLRS